VDAVVSNFGDPGAVVGAADALSGAAAAVESAHSLVQRADPEVWRGVAAEAFRESAGRSLPAALSLTDVMRAGSGTLTRYAAAQQNALSDYNNAQTDFDRASTSLHNNPLDLPAAFNLVQSRLAVVGAVGRIQHAALIAANELRAATGEDGDARPWWDPFGWFNDEEEPDERVSQSIMDDDAFDPEDVAQGGIGDCFMLSSIVSLLNTAGGDDFIRDNVRWDSDKNGFWVTLYSGGEPKEVFVEYVFDNGARQSDWEWWLFGGDKPSIAALYESAIRQEYGFSAIDGGVPADAMELITGRPVTVTENTDYSGLTSSQVDGLRNVLDDGGQVVISSPRSGDHQITVTAPDGSTREVEVVNTHSYAVMSIEPDGSVWVRNPWGPGNSADGGGEFLVSAADVAELFWRATSTNVTD
jgi:hypothetical protein